MLHVLSRLARSDRPKNAEILVPRHLVAVLQRQVKTRSYSGPTGRYWPRWPNCCPGSYFRQLHLIIFPWTLLRRCTDLVPRHCARLTRGGRQRRLKIHASWPFVSDIVTAWNKISTLPHAP
jgi:hypothetical protein